jgi:hypothetical protein
MTTANQVTRMRRALFMMLVAAACGGQAGPGTGAAPAGPPTSQDNPGAASPTLAIETFMAATKAQDLDALSLIWGSEKGPARDIVPPDQLRKRELIIQCYFQHDSYQIKSDVATSKTAHIVTLSVTRKDFTRETSTQVLLGPRDRWYVANPKLEPLQDLCSGASRQK